MATLSITKGQIVEKDGQLFRAAKNFGEGFTADTLPLTSPDLFTSLGSLEEAVTGHGGFLQDGNIMLNEGVNPDTINAIKSRTLLGADPLPTQQEQGTGAVDPLVPNQINPAGEPGFVAPTPTNQFAQTPNEAAGIQKQGAQLGQGGITVQDSAKTAEQLRQEKQGQIFDPVSGQIFGSRSAPREVLIRGRLLKPGEMGTIPSEETPQRNGKSIDEFAQEIDGATADEAAGAAQPEDKPSPSVGTSDAARAAKAEELGLPEIPQAPDLFTEADQARLSTAQDERAEIQEEFAEITNAKLKIQEEMQKFQDELTGLPEAGRVGAVGEKGRELQRRLDVLNRREMVLEMKLQNRNSTIDTLMKAQRQEFTDAVQQYQLKFNQAKQIYSVLEEEQDELVANAKSNLDVLVSAFTQQIANGQTTLNDVFGAHGTRLRELELQAGLPEGATFELMKANTANSQAGFEYKGTIGSSTTGYKALWVNPETGETKLDSLMGGTGGGGGGTAGGGVTQTQAEQNLLNVGLSVGLMNKGGSLRKGDRTKIIEAGVPPTVTDFIWGSITAGKSLDQIRQELTQKQEEAGSPDPRAAAFGSIDLFMQTLQSGSSDEVQGPVNPYNTG